MRKIGFELEYAGHHSANIRRHKARMWDSYYDNTYEHCYEICGNPVSTIEDLLDTFIEAVDIITQQKCLVAATKKEYIKWYHSEYEPVGNGDDEEDPSDARTGLHISVNDTKDDLSKYSYFATYDSEDYLHSFLGRKNPKLSSAQRTYITKQVAEYEKYIWTRRPYRYGPYIHEERVECKNGQSTFNPFTLFGYTLSAWYHYFLLTERYTIRGFFTKMTELLTYIKEDNAEELVLQAIRILEPGRLQQADGENYAEACYIKAFDFLCDVSGKKEFENITDPEHVNIKAVYENRGFKVKGAH